MNKWIIERTPRLALIGSVIAISLAILLPAAVSVAQTVSFSAATNFAVGAPPTSVAIGDLNGDGKPDLAVANYTHNVSILLGTGTGTFGAATSFAVGTNPFSVAIGDLNGDGKPDLAVANYSSNTVSILLGTGTGTFGAATAFAVGASPTSVAIGDLNGDGKPDLAVANYSSSTVSILLGTGTGTFGAATNLTVGSGPYSVAIGDLNGDGNLDLATANYSSNTVSILLGTGTGTFGAATNFTVGSGPRSVAIGDLNGDGHSDLAVANYLSATVSVLLGAGTGTFGAATAFAVGPNPLSVAIGDLNGDGKPDLAAANQNGIVSVLLGAGTGTFGAATVFAVGSNPSSVVIGDLNGDGKPDLAAANFGSNDVSILLNTTPYSPSGAFGAATDVAAGNTPSYFVAIGDLNGDGKPDLAVANADSDTVSILLGTGTGGFSAATAFAAGSFPLSVTIGDLNGDGKPDLAVADYGSGTVSILLGTGTGAFGAATSFAVGTQPTRVAIGDLNGDGKPDLAVANYGSDTVSILLGTGTGAFGAATSFAVGTAPRSVAIGDLNGDGKADLSVANANSDNVSILLGTGTGGFSAATAFAAGTQSLSVAIGDLNGDGKPDLAVANYGSNTVSILLGTGTGAFGAATAFAAGTTPYSVAIGDLNGDGKSDLAVTNSVYIGSGTVSILLGTGTGAFGAATSFAVGLRPTSVVIGDLNGDGKPDLAVANSLSTTVSVLLNIPPTLSVSKAGTGGGTVTSSPAGINCGATCSAPFDSGTVVTLTATPDATSTFTGWSGACTGTGTCAVTMAAAQSVTATFTRIQYALTVTKAGTGGGAVTSSPAGITCGVTCSASFGVNTVVTLTATPDATSTFTGWSGVCAGTGTCMVTMSAAQSVTAMFTRIQYALVVSKAGTGAGTVVSAPAGITCGATCSVSFDAGTVVSLTATPDGMSTFTGWGGACLGTGICTVTMDAAKSATATFVQNTITGSKIVFSSARDGNVEIYTMNPDGTNPTRLTNTTAGEWHTYWSPDGTKISFASDRDGGTSEVYVMNADGTNQTRLTNNPAADTEPVWSPDGTKIAFVSTRDGNNEIYVMNVDGTNQQRLTNNATYDQDIGWSPGSKIVFTSYRDGNYEIYTMNPDGTNQQRVTNNGVQDVTPAWSPDGMKIVFTRSPAWDPTTQELYVMNADGTGEQQLTNNSAHDGWPKWSPDGTKIVFQSYRDGNWETYVMNADGTGQTRLTNNSVEDSGASWSLGAPASVQFLLTVSTSGTGGGAVTSSPAGISCGGTCSASYDSGAVVTLMATPDATSTFAGWSGACSGTGTCIVTMDAAKAVTATFTRIQYTLSVTRTGTGGGAVTSSPAGINCGATCSAAFDAGTVVTLTATPDATSTFTGWSGACSGTGTCMVTMDAAKAVTATFTRIQYALNIAVSGTGTGTVTSAPSGINCGATCSASYDSGTVVTLTATPGTGSGFVGWSGDIDCADGVVTLDASKSCTATFDLNIYTLTVTRAGSGSGTVTSAPAGINCGVDCTENYAYGTVVTLTATPATGSGFSGWSGDPDCADGAVTLDVSKSCTATFDLNLYALNVTLAGTGNGTVTSSPTGITCGVDCTENYAYGTVVTLTATPATGSGFAGWSGNPDCSDGVVTVDASKSCTATFDLNLYTLTVALTGTGGGTVTSAPAGVNCGVDCTETYTYGTVVTLTATPDGTSTFTGWSGACSGTGTCTVTMDAAKSVTATFTRIQYALAVSKTGTGGGTVTSSPLGITCGATCSASFDAGAVVTLTATPDGTSSFIGWSGACTGTGTCVVTMTAPQSVTATFDTGTTPPTPPLANISSRARVLTGNDVLIGGFIISGTTPKTVLLRARGPSMGGAPFNIPGVLANPTMQLYSGATVIAQNNDWQTTDPLCGSPATACGDAPQISATAMDPCQPNPGQTVAPPGCAQESALLVTLPPGGYTTIVSGVGGGTGVGLVEVFAADTITTARLINISSRSRVETGNNVLIGGLIIGGTTSKTILLRARGPSMGGAPFNIPGVLANPTMQLYSGSTVIAQNDNWQTTDPLCGSPSTACGDATQISATVMDPCQPNPGQIVAPPNCGQEAAVLVTLPPGGYTAIVSGVSGGVGVGLVEVFEVP